MMHAFSASTGSELFAYVPSTLYRNLGKLTSPTYTHNYYVDGNMTAIDSFYNNNWHTVLTATLAAGGQGVFALDITNPALFSESNASSLCFGSFMILMMLI